MIGGNERDRAAGRVLARLRRTVEKAAKELVELESSIREADAGDFAAAEFAAAAGRIADLQAFLNEQAERLEGRRLRAGGISPDRLGRRPVSG